MKNTMKLFAMILVLVLAMICAGCANTPADTDITPSTQAETAPTVTEPAVSEPAPTEPEVTEPTPTEPEVTEPTPTEPEVTEPTPTEPEVTEPTPTEPEVTEPTPTEPEVTEPAPTEPEVTEPAPTEPEATEPASTQKSNVFFNPNNYAYDIDSLSIKPYCVYWMDGNLVAECFVINGFSHSVYNISVDSLSISNADGLIADGRFGNLKGLTLAPHQYVVWTFTFRADCISAANADLSSLTTNFSTSNWY